MTTHIVGDTVGILALTLCTGSAVRNDSVRDIIGALIYGISIVVLYTISSVYHALFPSNGKRVLQVIDHCSIYFLIETPTRLSCFPPSFPTILL